MKKILKDPIAYFFLLGFVVFGLHASLDLEKTEQDADPYVVEVTSADIEWLRSAWESRMQRKPTATELASLIDGYIREEILSREAQSMGLAEQDMVIKRRLMQKLLFVFEDLAETVEPTDDELKEYVQVKEEKYRIPELISFTHIYFNPDRRRDITRDAEIILDRLQTGHTSVAEASALGDAIMLDSSYDQMTPQGAARAFGSEFAGALFGLEGQGWQGPISSSFGLHLVHIDDHVDSRMPEFESVREQVRSDFMYDRKKMVIDEIYEAVKSRYTILVEGLPHD